MKIKFFFLVFIQLSFFSNVFPQVQNSIKDILNTDGKTKFLEKKSNTLFDSLGIWSTLGTSSINGVDGVVYAATIFNGELYVAGEFLNAGGKVANYIARWNGAEWNSVGTGTSNGVNNKVFALAVYNGELYVGGEFTSAGGINANFIARWNGINWNSVGTGTNNGVDGTVLSLAVFNNQLYLGGYFLNAGGLTANRIARWNGSSWSNLSSGTGIGVNSMVFALEVYKGELYVGGGFSLAGSINASCIARWNGSSWNNLSSGSTNGVNNVVRALSVFKGELYIGGSFTQAVGQSANYITRWNGSSFSTVGSGAANGTNGVVYALKGFNGELYAGGVIYGAGNVTANNIVRWDGNRWTNLISSNSSTNGVNDVVRCFEVFNGKLIVAGRFTQAGGSSANRIVQWSFSDNSPKVAADVIDFSTEYSSTSWSANQVIGAPDVYPNYGDFPNAWASATADGRREHLVIKYDNASPISYVAIYETFNPGAVDTIYVKNPNNGQWVVVWSGTAQSAGNVSRIFQVSFPMTTFNVSEIRIAINSPAVPGWNEIDAVLISQTPITSNEDYNNFELPDEFQLFQNFPNPFNPSTKISWQSPVSGYTALKVYDVLGNEVATLVDEYRNAGSYEVEFPNAETSYALSLPSGVYFYKLQVGEFVQTKKMILAK
jgi:hypothetical protein